MASLWKDLLDRIATLQARLTGRYQPEKYYMRGPGPRARAKANGQPAPARTPRPQKRG